MVKRTYSDSLRWLLIPLLLSAVSAVLRRWQLASAFEGDLKLPIPGAPASVIFLLFLLACALCLIFLARSQPVARNLGKDSRPALYAGGSALFLGALVCAAALTLVAAPVFIREGLSLRSIYLAALTSGEVIPGASNGLLTLLSGGVSALSFIALLVVGRSAQKGVKKGRLAILLPVINSCLWLMEFYRSHAANPVRWEYAILLLAIVAGILLYLDWAGLYAGVFAPRRALWLAGMTVVLSVTALMGDWSAGSALLLTSQTAAALALLWCAPHNLRYPPELPEEDAPAEEKLEEDTHE